MVKRILKSVGINKAIGYSSMARVIQAAGGLFTVFFIAANLSGNEQGYYYTFGSILALQIFFELGLGGIIIQYVAYEFAKLELSDNIITGDGRSLSRLASLLKLFSKWYGLVTALFFIAVYFGGRYFFSVNGDLDTNVQWEIPWLILCVTSSANLLLSPAIAFVEGIGKVKEIAKLRMCTQTLAIITTWSVLLLGGKLFASPATSSVTLIITLTFILVRFRKVLKQLFGVIVNEKISYKKEIFPYQWKIALSWISGYFIFQLFNPVLFKYSGPLIAGQMGMTMSALNGIMALTLSWTSTKVPFWSAFIARNEYKQLDESYSGTLRNSSIVCAVCLCLFWGFLVSMDYLGIMLYKRFLPLVLSVLLGLTIFMNNVVNIWATYLRCHKKEPFLIQSILVGVCCAASTILCGKYFGVYGVVAGYFLIVSGISVPLSYYIFKTKRKEFHG